MYFVDAHTHLDHFTEAELPQALAEIERKQIVTLANGIDIPTYKRTQAIARQSRWVIPSFGIHPWHAAAYADRLEELQPYIDQSSTLGEIGLDYHFVEDAGTYPAQREVFGFFLAAARAQNKVVNVHTKGAEADILEMLTAHTLTRVIIHWYSGPKEIFEEMVAHGYTFTIGVEVLHSDLIASFAKAIPATQLLTETDGPTTSERRTGRRSLPGEITAVVDRLAQLRATSPADIKRTVYQNFRELVSDQLDSGQPVSDQRLKS